MERNIRQNFFRATFPDVSFVDLSIIDYGYEECNPMHSYGPATRDYYLFHYILSGKGTLYTYNDERIDKVHIEGGKGFMVWPGRINKYIADEHDPWTYIWVGFTGLKAQGLVTQTGLTVKEPVYTARNTDEDDIVKNKLLNIVNNANSSPIELIGHFYLFLSTLIGSSTMRKKTSGDSLRDFYVNEAISYMEQNYQGKLTIDDIAAFCGLDRSYLSKIFRIVLKTTPQNFLIRYRVSKACELMKTTDSNIGDISGMVGYQNLFTFSRAFKKIMGQSPREWRAQNKLR